MKNILIVLAMFMAGCQFEPKQKTYQLAENLYLDMDTDIVCVLENDWMSQHWNVTYYEIEKVACSFDVCTYWLSDNVVMRIRDDEKSATLMVTIDGKKYPIVRLLAVDKFTWVKEAVEADKE